MSLTQTVKEDIAQMRVRFPKLMLLNEDGKAPSFAGILDVGDEAGRWYGSFSVRLEAPARYPYGIPLIFETGGAIERIADRHVNGDGSCCVAMEHTLLYRAGRGLMLHEFMQDFAYPYFANQLYFNLKGHYAASEYEHGFEGVVQFYRETLNTCDPVKAKRLLSAILNNGLPSRNAPCACGSGKKYKHCHQGAAEYLASLERFRLLQDYAGFETLLASRVSKHESVYIKK